MKKILCILTILFGFSSLSHASDSSKIEVRGSINDGSSTVLDSGLITKYFSSGVRQQQTVSCDGSTYTNISVPSGAKAVLIDVGSNRGLKLKGVTGDTGISMDSSCPILLPLSSDNANTTLGIRNDYTSGARVKVFWF